MIEQKTVEIVSMSHTKCDSINSQTATNEQIKMEPIDEQAETQFALNSDENRISK